MRWLPEGPGRGPSHGVRRASSASSPAGVLPAVAAALLVAACSAGSAGGDGTWAAERTRVGDTTIVHTVSGSVWGPDVELVEELRIGVLDGDEEYVFGRIMNVDVGRDGAILVLERGPASLRTYDASGRFVRTIAREGRGPGELHQPMRVETLSDGRVIVWDPGNQRVNVYAADGSRLDEWPVRSNLFSVRPLTVDSADNVYVQVLMGELVEGEPWPLGQLRLDSSGAVLDTLPEPLWKEEARILGGRGAVMVHPGGYFVSGWSGEYAFHVLRDPPIRIEKAWTPVVLTAPERDEWEALARRQRERGLTPISRSGAVDMTVPESKPAYKGILIGRDGRLWVHLHVEVEEHQVEPGSTERRWREPVVFDVFESDGRYLGRIRMPPGASAQVQDGDHVWGVQRGANDEPYVVRWRIERGGPAPAS